MYVKHNIDWGIILMYAWKNLLFFILWATLVFSAYLFLEWKYLDIPFQPLSVIGIAVAFYIGFKNSQSYHRFWGGRKIWGGIVNYSRTWANTILSHVKDYRKTKKILIYKHLAWINALRIQLRQPRSFSIKDSKALEKLFDEHGERNPVCKNVKQYMYATELANFQKRKNADSHLVKNQRLHFKKLLEEGKFTDFDKQVFHHTLEELYNLQGKCEHIKNTPFSRQYAYFSTLFTWLFLLLLLFGLFNVFETELTEAKQVGSSWPIILMFFFLVLISWIFKPMEKVGSNSEDPFEERINNVPMTTLCWTIETRAC